MFLKLYIFSWYGEMKFIKWVGKNLYTHTFDSMKINSYDLEKMFYFLVVKVRGSSQCKGYNTTITKSYPTELTT